MDPKTQRVPHRVGRGDREGEHTHAWESGREGEGERARERERQRAYARVGEREKESETPLAPLFICFFLPPGPVLCKLGLGRSAVLPEVLTPVLGPSFDLPLFYFCRFFPSLSFSHHHFELLFPILTT